MSVYFNSKWIYYFLFLLRRLLVSGTYYFCMYYFFTKTLKFSSLKFKMKKMIKVPIIAAITINSTLFGYNVILMVFGTDDDKVKLTVPEKCLFKDNITKEVIGVVVTGFCMLLSFKVY